MSARTQAFVLVLFGGALLRLATTDALLRYVRPVARPWVLLAGAAVVALALWSLAVGSGRPDAEHEADEHQTDEHQTDEHQTDEHQTDEHQAEQREADGHRHRGASRAAWLVLAPVVAILVVAPPALGAYSAKRLPVSAIKVPSRHVPALTGTDLVRMSLLDYYSRAAFDDGRTLVGRRVALTGFVLRVEPGGFQLARLMITCCAADARPVVVSVQHTSAPASNGWDTVTGTYGGMRSADATAPVLRADTVTPIRQPANPYD